MKNWTALWIRLGSLGILTAVLGGVKFSMASDHLPSTQLAQAAMASGVTHRLSGEYRYISANGIPTHATGQFPNRNNPNRISPQDYAFRMPLNPKKTGKPTYTQRYVFGVARNGVVFDPGTAEYWGNDRSWRYEALSGKINLGLDQSHAHVQPTGAYHYHGSPEALIAQLGSPSQPALLGYAADGFPIYNSVGVSDTGRLTTWRSSYRVKAGERSGGPGGSYDGTFVQDYEYVSGLGDLDECNGREGKTTEFPQGTYYYVITKSFPFVPRCFMGTPDQSFAQKRPGNGSGNRSGQNRNRPSSGYGQPPRRGSGGDRPPHPPHRHPHHPKPF